MTDLEESLLEYKESAYSLIISLNSMVDRYKEMAIIDKNTIKELREVNRELSKPRPDFEESLKDVVSKVEDIKALLHTTLPNEKIVPEIFDIVQYVVSNYGITQ